MEKFISMREKLPNMAKRLYVHDIRQFDEDGIKEYETNYDYSHLAGAFY